MWLKASLLSFLLLLASRFAGLGRDAAQAAALGSTGMADVAVLLFSWPDWLAGLLAGGVLAYVLLPRWQRMEPAAVEAAQRQLAQRMLVAGVLVALAMWLMPSIWVSLLAPGLQGGLRPYAMSAWQWSAIAVPLAFLATAWATRLQFAADLPGLYASNLVVNGVLIAGLLAMVLLGGRASSDQLALMLAASVVLAGLLRLLWQLLRLHNLPPTTPPRAASPPPKTRAASATTWTAAMGCSAIAVLLPVWARSLASGAGAGELALFHYGWKLVELPLGLVIQLLGVVALGVLTNAVAHANAAEQQRCLGMAMRAAWVLSMACVAALGLEAEFAARLVFGWGKSTATDVLQMGAIARAAAWALPGLALMSVALAWSAAKQQLDGQWSTPLVVAGLAGLVTWAGHGFGTGSGVAWMLAGVCAAAGICAVFNAKLGLLNALVTLGRPGLWATAVAGLAWATGAQRGYPWQTTHWSLNGLLAASAAALCLLPWLLSADAAGLRKRLVGR